MSSLFASLNGSYARPKSLNETVFKVAPQNVNVTVPVFDATTDGHLEIKTSHNLGAASIAADSQKILDLGIKGEGGPLMWQQTSPVAARLVNPSYVAYRTLAPDMQNTGYINTTSLKTSQGPNVGICEYS